jgi:hypothetical protein
VTDDIFNFTPARATARANLTAGWLNGGTMDVYDGTRPTPAGAAITDQTLLVTYVIPDPSGTVENGVLTAGDIAPAMAAESGDATWVRAFDADAVAIGDGDVGATGSGAFVELDNTSLVQGGYVSVVSLTLTEH